MTCDHCGAEVEPDGDRSWCHTDTGRRPCDDGSGTVAEYTGGPLDDEWIHRAYLNQHPARARA